MAVSCRPGGPTVSASWPGPSRNGGARRPSARSPTPRSRSSPPVAVPLGERCSCDEVIDAGVVARSALLNAGDAAEGALGHQNRCGAVLVTADNVRLGEAVLEMTVQYASCGSK